MMVKEEDEDRIILTDRVATNVFSGLGMISLGLCLIFGYIAHADFDDIGLLGMCVGICVGLVAVLFGGVSILEGFDRLLVRKSVIIDKRLQSIIIMEKSPIKYFKSIKKISFVGVRVEITYTTYCEKCNYNSPSTPTWGSFMLSNDSWNVSLITSDDGSIQIYDGGSKSKAEKLAENICRITGVLARHQTDYIPPNIV